MPKDTPKKVGRPPVGKAINIRIEPGLMRRIEAFNKVKGHSQAGAIRRLISDGLDTYGF